MEKVIIEVLGGSVVSVYTSSKDVDVEVVDFDNINKEEMSDDEFKSKIKGLNSATSF